MGGGTEPRASQEVVRIDLNFFVQEVATGIAVMRSNSGLRISSMMEVFRIVLRSFFFDIPEEFLCILFQLLLNGETVLTKAHIIDGVEKVLIVLILLVHEPVFEWEFFACRCLHLPHFGLSCLNYLLPSPNQMGRIC